MKDELRNLDIAELGELSKAAKLDETKMIDLWKDKVGAKIENPLPAPITRVNTQKLSAWGRATKRIEKQRKSERDSGESRTTSGESGGRRSRLGSVAERTNSGSPGRIARLLGLGGMGRSGDTRKSRASKRSPLAPAAAPAPAEDGAQWVLGETTTSGNARWSCVRGSVASERSSSPSRRSSSRFADVVVEAQKRALRAKAVVKLSDLSDRNGSGLLLDGSLVTDVRVTDGDDDDADRLVAGMEGGPFLEGGRDGAPKAARASAAGERSDVTAFKSEEKSPPPTPPPDEPDLEEAMRERGLTQYTRKLRDDQGFVSVAALLRLKPKDLEAVIDAIRPMPGHRTRILGAIEDMRAGGPPYTGRAPAAAPAPAATPPSRSPVPSDDESGGSLPEMM